jgi:Restriction endonuclease BglII
VKITELYSHLNGHEHILVHKPSLWQDIEDVINAVDASKCRTKVSKEQRTIGQSFYSPVDMNKEYGLELAKRDWNESRTSYWVTSDYRLIRKTMQLTSQEQFQAISSAGLTPIRSYNQTDFVKDRIAIEIRFGKYAFVAYDLFVKHVAFYVGDVIDVGIEILPMKSLQSQMSSGVGYYEGELYNLIRQGRGIPAVPLVIIGVSP